MAYILERFGKMPKVLSTDEASREIIYQMTMSDARIILRDGYISRQEYDDFNTRMQQKYRPIFGTLFSDINLL